MNKEKKIEKIAMLVSPFGYCMGSPCGECQSVMPKHCSNYEAAKRLYNAGYGDVGQAIEDFSYKLRAGISTFTLCEAGTTGIECVSISEVKNLIESLVKQFRVGGDNGK